LSIRPTERATQMARIALKVDVDTLRGTREGVPKLLSMLAAAQAQATFLFSLGPDHTGWALRRVFRPGFLTKVSRTSVVSNYGLRTLMYGVLLPGPDIGRKGAAEMRAARAAGHECGIHTWDHVYWQDNVRERDAAWTRRQMQQAFARYREIFTLACGRYGTSIDYARQTFEELRRHGIHDAALARLVRLAEQELSEGADCGSAPAGLYPQGTQASASSTNNQKENP